MAETRNQNEIAVRATPIQSIQAGNGGGLPPNGTFCLWQIMLEIMKYERTVQKNNADVQVQFATALGGLDGHAGIFQGLAEIGSKVGDLEAQGLMADAWGKFGQAITSGLSVAASGLKYLASTKSAVNEAEGKLTELGKVKGAIDNERDGFLLIKQGDPSLAAPKPSAAVKARIEDWSNGNKLDENFDGTNPDGSVTVAEARLNRQAAAHLGSDPELREKVMKKLSAKEKQYRNAIQSAHGDYQSFQSTNQVMTNGAGSLSAGVGESYQAQAAADKGRASSANQIVSQVQQQVSAQENKAEQNAEQAQQQANQWAAAFAQAASSQVHA